MPIPSPTLDSRAFRTSSYRPAVLWYLTHSSMPTTNPDPNHLITYTYTRPNFSPFYIISIVLSSIILLAILLLLGRASYRQRVLRRRWTRLLMFGNVRVDWRVREQEERVVNTKAPVLREISISWRDSVEFDKSHVGILISEATWY